MMSAPTRNKTRLTLRAVALVGVLALSARAEPLISEFMASNTATLADNDGAYSDWIEVHNPDAASVNLAGWYLTDTAANKTKWQFPAVTLEPGGHLVVFASNKNRRDPTQPLHTNFALSAGGEYLGLVKSDGTTVVSEYAPTFPTQTNDISYGTAVVAPGAAAAIGFFRKPSPGAANGGADALRLLQTVAFSRASGPFVGATTIELSGAGPGQRIRYVVVTGSDTSEAEPTASAPVYTGPITLSTTALVRAAVFSDDDSVHGLVAAAHYLRVGASVAAFSSNLPVIVLDDHGHGALAKDGIDHAAWAYTYTPAGNGNAVFGGAPGLASPLVMTVRGSSSAEFPKKGYNVKLRDDAGGKRAASLLDLPTHEKWALVAPWAFDQNYINNAFAYALSNRLGRWAARTRLAEVFFNTGGDTLEQTDYAGIYVVTDRIEPGKERVDIAGLSSTDVTAPAITGGYILKLDAKDPDEIGWVTDRGVPENGVSSVVLVYPKAEDIAPAQLDFVKGYVKRMEDALHADRAAGWVQRTYLDYIDRDSWVDHHLLNVLLSNPDAFHRSAYFHKERGGRLKAGPLWDFDRALGAYWDDRSSVVDTWSGVNGTVDYWRTGWWGVLAEDPEFRQDWIDRWQSLRKTELSGTRLADLAQSLADGVGPDAAARDAAQWPDNASPYGSYAAQIDHLKNWLRQRANWIDGQFLAPPTSSSSGDVVTFTAPVGAVLVYTLDGSDPRSLGGAPAPNARLTAGPLTVAAGANVHVRSYQASLATAFPGSPWSSAVGGTGSSPLSPKSRLVNLSSRGLVGTAENALIAGVIVADTASKPFLARAIGPGLAQFGPVAVVPDPQLSIFRDDGVEILRNIGWENDPSANAIPALAKSVGAFPLEAGTADSVLTNAMSRGAYTLQVTTPSGRSGIGLAEFYELDTYGRTANLSTRGLVRTGEGVLIGGFVIQGTAYKRMLVRAVGPTLGVFGLSNALLDPVLTVYSGQTVIAANDRWGEGDEATLVAAASARVGAFALPTNSEDAALLITLPPGAYTLEVKGKVATEGTALLEIYEVP